MFKILVADSLAEEGINILKSSKDFIVDIRVGLKPPELKAIVGDYDALVVRSATKVTHEIIEAGAKLKIIGRAGVGLDNVDLKAATAKGIIVMNTPGGNTISTAEHTMSMIMSLSRSIPQADQSMKKNEWRRKDFMGVELYNKTIGIIGLGRIGMEVAKRCLAFGMRVKAYDPFLSKEVADQLGVELMKLDELYKSADFITVHVPLTEETTGMIGDKQFEMMKPGARVINCARGGIIDEAALARALESGKAAGAALDVYVQEPPKDLKLAKFNNVVLTPHLGASTEEAQINVAIEVAHQISDALLGKGIRNAANYPSVDPEAYHVLQPYINLCERLGNFTSQISEGALNDVKITYSGDIAKNDTAPLTMALLKGLLSPMLQDTVNFINARALAKDRGIRVTEMKDTQVAEFVNLISLEVKTHKEIHRIAGTLFTKSEPRLVKLDEFFVEAIPSGCMVLMHNWDKPGIIGNVGRVMGEHNINIAAMSFGRDKQGGRALTVLNVDACVSPQVLEKIKALEHVLSVKTVQL
ncbi:MAG: phosphoglycerate dehydrogenase [Candidatus Omnitrophica bacterium CG1_02_44_16]|nr:MAG: phosphoglycerate dehydrogenase [Candidatus Omnitrophica bacterium CG1_02_44_16]PIY82642.1 MAG: phosphoglycerate dehydrogenase [Candidatus Omnitrophica bacterium CG_4_10_14_0_8_um_filter_44_12]PIZ84792.1 MAG: phosphoglycerate dehydrogenase [Candidatus Omnitrophica bacterium CG_4_10_14_0_2_um_filter_44_9]